MKRFLTAITAASIIGLLLWGGWFFLSTNNVDENLENEESLAQNTPLVNSPNIPAIPFLPKDIKKYPVTPTASANPTATPTTQTPTPKPNTSPHINFTGKIFYLPSGVNLPEASRNTKTIAAQNINEFVNNVDQILNKYNSMDEITKYNYFSPSLYIYGVYYVPGHYSKLWWLEPTLDVQSLLAKIENEGPTWRTTCEKTFTSVNPNIKMLKCKQETYRKDVGDWYHTGYNYICAIKSADSQSWLISMVIKGPEGDAYGCDKR